MDDREPSEMLLRDHLLAASALTGFSVSVRDIDVTVRGIMVDGQFQLGTAFIPPP